MKPTRGLTYSWLSNLPRERKVAMGTTAVLVVLLGALMVYQRFAGAPPMADDSIIDQPLVEGAPHATQPADTAPPVQADAGATPVPAAADTVKPGAQTAAAEPARTEAPKQLLKPLAGDPKVAQPYAFMYSDVYGDFRLHPGIDYSAQTGESILAAASGTVSAIDTDPAEGKVVVIDHGGGVSTMYAGLGKVMVSLNASVQPGSIIGQVGEPTPVRKAVGAHLHYEVLVNGSPVDPDTFAHR